MRNNSQIKYIERFHLLFLAQLGRKIAKSDCALKGGCNLRFFFKSPRFSEDMDLDIQTLPVAELRDRVNGLLKSDPFRQALAVHGLDIEHVTEAKQTATTQLWKFGLRTPGATAPVPTKIEFSRRDSCSEAVLENVDPLLIRSLDLAPLMFCHYPAGAAWCQKVRALAMRARAQARDLFDLNLLLCSGAVRPAEEIAGMPADLLHEAEERCLAMPFDDFKGQVLAFLAPEQQADYDSAAVWEQMSLRVAEALRGQP